MGSIQYINDSHMYMECILQILPPKILELTESITVKQLLLLFGSLPQIEIAASPLPCEVMRWNFSYKCMTET